MNNTLTLWQLLSQQEIVVPMIQRDYAQGRVGKEHIRSAFLKDVKAHLSDGTNLTLDFVYGNTEGGKFHPLDGQQRLTTLWLVHWYVAFRLGKLKETSEILKRFSYQTRTSSRDFCKMLCEEMAETDPNIVDNVAEYIKAQTWFFSEWTQDPTVSAMLCTLSNNKNGNEDDHIQGVFCNGSFPLFWENLTQKNIITFELMIIGTDNLPISDDLYIKMNARGKKLTDFENFKADWISHIQSNPVFSTIIGEETLSQYYARRIDNEWTDVFWNSREKTEKFDGNIDSIFFSFINRFVLNQHCLQEENAIHYNSSKHTAVDDRTRALQKKFDILYGTGLGKRKKSNDDSLIEYKGFDVYLDDLTQTNMERLDKIFEQLNANPGKIRLLNFSGLDEDETAEETTNQDLTYYFLPQYTEETGLLATRLKERIYFHAICLFLENPCWDKLEDWKRIVRNLVENAAIENVEAMIGCLREIDGLGKLLCNSSWDVYANLAAYTMKSTVGQLVKQWEEEKQKATQILAHPDMLATIVEAEKYAFFKGTIRFLFTGADGSTTWDNFAIKLENAKKRFSNNEKVSVDTIKRFLGMFETFEDLGDESYFFTTEGYHSRNSCWKKNILCNGSLYKQVDAFLLDASAVAKDDYLEFLESGALEVISKKSHNYNYRYHNSKDIGVHRDYSTTEGIYTSHQRRDRNKIMIDLQTDGIITMDADAVLGNGFLWGKEITFTCCGKQFFWSIDWDCNNWIRLVTDPQVMFKWENEDKHALTLKLQSLM